MGGVVAARAGQGPVPALHPCLPIPDDRAEMTSGSTVRLLNDAGIGK